MTSYSCYLCKYLIYSLSWMSGLWWLLHFHSPLVHSRWGQKSPANFSTCFPLSLKVLSETVCDFLQNRDSLTVTVSMAEPDYFTLLFCFWFRNYFDLWPFFASFLGKLLSKTFGNKTFTFTALHVCSKWFFFSFLENHTD